MKRSITSLMLIMTCVALFAVMSMSTAIARNNASDLLDDPVANRKAVFQLIYEEAGYSKRDAETLTIRALTRIRGYAVPV
ncbi:MAG: hypothetical protein KDA30_16045, partial [Phycisphaerales bacterium]|nr:hypothetical protein [Phycisphaerales bacterium]